MKKKFSLALASVAVALISVSFMALLLMTLLLGGGTSESRPQNAPAELRVGDRFKMFLTNSISGALDGVLDIKKVYWLSDDDVVAPKPDADKFGTTTDPAEIAQLLENAGALLEGQDTVLTPQVPLARNANVTYYLDETIFVATWKQKFDNSIYTISEIKIAHPSQFRRFLAGGSYGSGIQLITTDMADSVNAVVASSGDFYAFRRHGIIVYDGTVYRVNTEYADTCFIDDQGNMIFSPKGQLSTLEEAQRFVDENNIRFSLAFGPILMDDGEKVDYHGYALGEVYGVYARSALCQMGPLHYLLVVCAKDNTSQENTTIRVFQDIIASFGCQDAYALDGGQTAAIAMQGKTINRVAYGYQRQISDIIYFATAMPDRE